MVKGTLQKNWTKIYLKKLFWKIMAVLILMGIMTAVPFIWPKESKLLSLLMRLNAIAITAMFMAIVTELLKITYELLYSKPKYKKTPLKGIVQIAQIVIYFIGGIIMVAILLDKSPVKLLTGLGALTAVLSFISRIPFWDLYREYS